MSRMSFLLLVLVAFLLVNGASATVVNLNTTEAIDSSNTTDRHHIIVNPGNYNENVLVN
ncbi:MAG: hypothetical protein PWQ74_1366 [Methanobacteriaceae archaeon]|nr:hypothetical protein [Methanobacteriaceae archaeon]